MPVGGAILSGSYSDASALSTLLTVESLLFAALSVSVALSAPTTAIRNLSIKPRSLGIAVATFLSVVAAGAFLCWTGLFLDNWPCNFRGAVVALIIAAAIIGQPVFAWIIALGLGRAGDKRTGAGV